MPTDTTPPHAAPPASAEAAEVITENTTAAAARLRHYFETLSPAALAQLGDHYAPQARFRDPFNEVEGLAAIRAVFEHMYAQLHRPTFVVQELLVQPARCVMTWDFLFGLRPGARALGVQGCTHFHFDADGRVTLHRDYWDACDLYGQLPLLRAPMRWLRQRMTVSSADSTK